MGKRPGWTVCVQGRVHWVSWVDTSEWQALSKLAGVSSEPLKWGARKGRAKIGRSEGGRGGESEERGRTPLCGRPSAASWGELGATQGGQ